MVQSDAYAGTVGTLVVAEVTKNLTMADDPACLHIDTSTPEGRGTGLVRDSALSCLVGAKQPGPSARVIGETRRPAVDLR